MTKNELPPLPAPGARYTCSPELAARMERLGIPHVLVTREELESMAQPLTQEEEAYINRGHQPMSPLPEPEPRITSNPELAAQMGRLGIPHVLVTEDELNAIAPPLTEEEEAYIAKVRIEPPPIPKGGPRITCDPELAAQMERLGIPHKLVSPEELQELTRPHNQADE